MNATCTALGLYANARSQAVPDKDVILDVKRTGGRDRLIATRLSEMSYGRRFVRFFGYGTATLTSVSAFLQSNEPYLAKKRIMFAWGREFYTPDTIEQLDTLSKARLKELRSNKARGCEIFKRCLSHHNQNSRYPVYIELKDRERKGLNYDFFRQDGIRDPMCRWDKEDKDAQIKYRTPRLNPATLLYLPPNLRARNPDELEPQVLGFCHEYASE